MECIFTDLGLPLVAAGHNLAGDKQGYHIQMCRTSCQGCSYTAEYLVLLGLLACFQKC